MTMPKFEPVAWLRDTLDGGLSTMTDCCTNVVKEIWLKANPKNVERYTAPLYTLDQLTEAYEAGKRDAIPEWQPIETAPKDGTAFRAYADELVDLDFNPCGSVEAVWNGEEFIGCVWNGQQDTWYGKAINPTHWMPLPAAPKGEE